MTHHTSEGIFTGNDESYDRLSHSEAECKRNPRLDAGGTGATEAGTMTKKISHADQHRRFFVYHVDCFDWREGGIPLKNSS